MNEEASAANVLWEPPLYQIRTFFPRRTRYCVCVTVLNEGDRIQSQLSRMKESAHLADIIIADGGSTDGSVDPRFLEESKVRALLITGESGLSTATRMALAFAMDQGYEGVITIDGNGKDGVEAIPQFLEALDQGVDLAQSSRFMKGGFHKNTPFDRYVGIKFILPLVFWLGCGYGYTDASNAFRAMSMRFLKDARVQPIRRVFVRFNLQHYVVYRAAKLGFRVKEIPVRRVYPDDDSVPTKVLGWKLKFMYLLEAAGTVTGKFNPT